MKKIVKVMAVIMCITAVILTGCGSQIEKKTDKPVSTASDKKQKTLTSETKTETAELNIAYMPNYCSLWAIENAINKGYLEEEGLKVNLVEFQDGPTIIAAMESGSIDIGFIGQGAHKLCINGKAKIIALSHISNSDAVIAANGITKVEELKGKKVAYSSGSSSEDILVNSLNKVGMKMNDIEAIDMDAATIVTSMLSGSVDACATWSPNTIKILEEMQGAVKLTDNMTFSDKTVSLDSWVVIPDYAEKNADIILRFTRALFKAMDYAANDHFEETSKYIAAQTAQDYSVVFAQRTDAKWFTGREVSKGATDGSIEKYYELQKKQFIESGAVEVDPPVLDYVLFGNMIKAGEY